MDTTVGFRALSRLAVALVAIGSVVACGSSSSGDSGTTGSGGGADGGGGGGGGGGTNPVAADGTGASCTADKDCKVTDSLCLFHDGAAVGYCSKPCSGASDCPSDFYCARAGNVSHLYCILESSLVDDCNKDCDDYNVAGCLSGDGLTKCRAACAAAKPGDQVSFDGCAATSIAMCTTACIDTLCKASNTSCGDVTASKCMRDSTLDMQCKGMGLPGTGYSCEPGEMPKDTSCKEFAIPDSYCCAK